MQVVSWTHDDPVHPCIYVTWDPFVVFASSLNVTVPCSLVVCNKLSKRDTNTRPCLTYLHMKCSLTSNCCSSIRDAVCLSLHRSTSSEVSCALSGANSITMATVLKRIPRKTMMLVALWRSIPAVLSPTASTLSMYILPCTRNPACQGLLDALQTV